MSDDWLWLVPCYTSIQSGLPIHPRPTQPHPASCPAGCKQPSKTYIPALLAPELDVLLLVGLVTGKLGKVGLNLRGITGCRQHTLPHL
jgi:hypothetical protein